jgi:hypothetical protein
MNSPIQLLKSKPEVATLCAGVLLVTIFSVTKVTTAFHDAQARAAVRDAQAKAVAAGIDPRVAQAMAQYAQSAQNTPAPKYPVLPNQARPMEGTLTFTYNYKQPSETEVREGQVKFQLTSQMGALQANGIGSIKVDYSADSINPICRGVAEHIVAKGDGKIEGGGAIGLYGGVLELKFGGDLPVVETKLVSNGNHCEDQIKNYPYYYGTICRFENVDLVKGGKYSTTKPDGGGGQTECIIEISPT